MTNPKEIFYCPICSKIHKEMTNDWRCSSCGEPLQLEYDVTVDVNIIKNRQTGMWRYREVIPIKSDSNIISFSEGWTPVVKVKLGSIETLVKQDHLFPSGSYKDRGASVLISKIRELGITEIVEDSSGNAGAAVAAYCARAGIRSRIYVPESTSPGKLAQILNYGAELVKIPGSRDDTAAETLKAAKHSYYASHVWNPYFFHGTKTFAWEVCEQLGWNQPDAVILPAGNGTILIGCHIGFWELLRNRLIKGMPKIIGVQAKNCAPVYCASGGIENCRISPTIAEGIAIGRPARKKEMIKAVRETGGYFITVSETEILDSLKMMNRQGFCLEPTSAAVIAGCRKYAEAADRSETIVSLITGHGLKAGGKVLQH